MKLQPVAILTLLLCWPPTAAAQASSWPDAWADGQPEQLTEASQAALASGEFALAERQLLQALQLSKVNYGLHSLRQIPILEQLIAAQLSLGDWKAVDERIDYFKWLNSRNLRNDLEAYLQGTEALSDLLLKASANPDNPQAVRFLVQSRNLDWQAVTALENRRGESARTLAPWFYRIARSHFYQSALVRRRYLSNYTYKSDGSDIVSGWSMPHNEMLDISYRIGRDLLGRVQAMHRDSSGDATVESALARVYQGDWELLFDRNEAAYSLYKQAYQELLAAGLSRQATDRFFARPLVLPEPELNLQWPRSDRLDKSYGLLVTAWSPLYPGVARPASIGDAGQHHVLAVARFDLLPGARDDRNETGGGPGPFIRGLEIRHSEPDSESARQQALRGISLLHFRPRLQAAQSVPLENVVLHYRFAAAHNVTANREEELNSEANEH